MNATHATTSSATKRSYGPSRKKVPAFARYEGTSAWRKDRRRVRAYEAFKVQQATAAHSV